MFEMQMNRQMIIHYGKNPKIKHCIMENPTCCSGNDFSICKECLNFQCNAHPHWHLIECEQCLNRRAQYITEHPEITENDKRELFLNGKAWLDPDKPRELGIGLIPTGLNKCPVCNPLL